MAFGKIKKYTSLNSVVTPQRFSNPKDLDPVLVSIGGQDPKSLFPDHSTSQFFFGDDPAPHPGADPIVPTGYWNCFRKLTLTLYIKVEGGGGLADLEWELDAADGVYKSQNTFLDKPGCGTSSKLKKECQCLAVTVMPGGSIVMPPGFGLTSQFTITQLGPGCLKAEKIWPLERIGNKHCFPAGTEHLGPPRPIFQVCECSPSWEQVLYDPGQQVQFHIPPPNPVNPTTAKTAIETACDSFKGVAAFNASQEDPPKHFSCCTVWA